MMQKWKTLESKIVFDTPWFKVRQDAVQLPNGKAIDDYYVWLQGDIALIVPITAKREFVLVKQYKHAAGAVLVEYPAGFIRDGEEPKDAAEREFREETGYTFDTLTLLSSFAENPTKVVGKTYVFLATNARAANKQNLDDSEQIEVIVWPWQKVVKMILAGKIWATPSVAATFMALERMGWRKNNTRPR